MTPKQRARTILTVSLISATVNSVLALLKIMIGKIGHSQALIADGAHSFSDLISDALVYLAARASGQEPDPEHPYGHQRIETIATVVVAIILIAVSMGILYDAVLRFVHPELHVLPSMWVVIAAIVSIFANEALFWYSKKSGEKIKSTLLVSNAWHNRSDAFVSIIVLLSVIGTKSGLPWLDGVGAVVIALLILKMGGKMIWQSTKELIDTGVDETMLDQIKQTITSACGVVSLHQLRTRLHGEHIFVDCHIIVDPTISVSEGHHIGDLVHQALMTNVPAVKDVTVHIDPEDDEKNRPSIHLPNREEVKKLINNNCKDLPFYNQLIKINLHYLAGELTVELYFPVSILNEINANAIIEQYQTKLSSSKNITHIKLLFKQQ